MPRTLRLSKITKSVRRRWRTRGKGAERLVASPLTTPDNNGINNTPAVECKPFLATRLGARGLCRSVGPCSRGVPPRVQWIRRLRRLQNDTGASHKSKRKSGVKGAVLPTGGTPACRAGGRGTLDRLLLPQHDATARHLSLLRIQPSHAGRQTREYFDWLRRPPVLLLPSAAGIAQVLLVECGPAGLQLCRNTKPHFEAQVMS